MMSADIPLQTPRTRATRNRIRDRLLVGALLVLFLVGVIGLAAATGWQETWDQISRLSVWQIALLLSLSMVNYLLRGLRWHLFARRLGLPTTLRQDLRHFLGGFAMSVTPGRLGELVRMRWLTRETGWSFDRTAPLVLVDRASDLAAVAILLGLSISLAAGGISGAVPVTILALAMAVVATRPTLLTAVIETAFRLIGRMPRFFARARASARSLDRFSHGPVLASALGLGLVGWFAEGFAFHLLLVWMGADIGVAKAIAIFIFSTLAGSLTGAPGGVGGAEAAMIALLSLDGVPLGASVAATAIIRVTTLWFAVVIGLVVFPIAERLSLKGPHALEKI